MERTACLVVLLVWVTMVSCVDNSLDERWERFKTDNNRKYRMDVEPYRRGIWEAKIKEIEQHNQEADEGVHSYWMQETEWDDLTFQEFIHFGDDFDVNDIHRVKRASKNGTGDCFNEQTWSDSSPYPYKNVTTLPTNVDWKRKGYVTSVKNQGACGSCWAFSAVGAIEGQWYKKSKKLVSLSPQFLVDCSTRNNGCKGGLPYKAFDFVIKNKGIPSESSYPYKAKKNNCMKKATVAKINGLRTINSENELLNAVAYIGPISVGIQTGSKITNVGQGVFTGCTGPINHAVLVVGYGVYNNKKVWKIKNSWGSSWGNKGYFYMTREVSDACGIAQYASYPTVDGVARGPIGGGEVSHLTTGAGGIPKLSVLAFILSVTLALFNN